MNFKTYEEALDLFRKVNCIGDDNCIFVTYKDPNINSTKYALFGAVGGAIGAMAAFTNGMVEGLEGCDGLLINQTENGLGLIPLLSKGMQMVVNVSKMEPQLDRFVFVPNNAIESIEIKNFNFLNKKLQKVTIKINGLKPLYHVAKVSDKDIEYQEQNFTKFMNKCKDGIKVQEGVNTFSKKNDVNLINNNDEKEKFANLALNILINNNMVSDVNGISCEYGYLYNIDGHGYEGLFKIKKLDKTYYFAVQGEELKMISLDEPHFIAYRDSFIERYK